MRRFLVFLGGFILCFSCTQDPEVAPAADPVPDSPYAISQEEALRNLSDALASIDTPQTRGGRGARRVADVTTLSRADLLGASTRAELLPEDRLNRVYLVSFEGGEGSAILAADARLEPVIAIYDEYQIKPEDLQFIGEKVVGDQPAPDRKLEDYYCAEDDDYYLGMSGGVIDDGFIHREILVEYILYECTGGVVYTKEGEWQTLDYVRPMLTTRWHQGDPFDKFTPGNYPAGCVAIAVAQIMAYHEFPRDYCKWDVAKSYNNVDYANKAEVDYELGLLSANIGRGCLISYNFLWSGQSFATPIQAKRFLRNIGYYGTKRHIGYDEDVIVAALKEDCPVFIGAMDPKCHGHAWVIDGFVFRRKTDLTYCAEALIDQSTHDQMLLHCNWGWKSTSANGYFVSKVFDAVNGRVADEIDLAHTRGKDSKNYTWWFRIVTYSKP